MISEHSAHSTSLPVGFRTWFWRYTCLFLLILMLWRASDIRIERRQVAFPCRMQDSNPRSLTPICQQTECLLTNRLSYRESSLKTWTRQPVPMISKHSAHSTTPPVGFRTWLWRYICLLLLISMLWHRQAISESKRDKLSKIQPKLELYGPSLWSASIQPSQPHCQLAFAPGSGEVHVCCF